MKRNNIENTHLDFGMTVMDKITKLEEENERLKEQIKQLTFERDFCLDVVKDIDSYTAYSSVDIDKVYFDFTIEEEYKYSIILLTKIYHLALDNAHKVYELQNDDLTFLFFSEFEKNFGFFKLLDLSNSHKNFIKLTNIYFYNTGRLNVFGFPKHLINYFETVHNTINSVMKENNVYYWDSNIFSIIKPYLCLPYHLIEQ